MNLKEAKHKLMIFPMEKELVLARLETWPPTHNLIVGDQEYTIEELREEVRNETEFGKKIIEMEMTWLRSFKDGGIWAST